MTVNTPAWWRQSFAGDSSAARHIVVVTGVGRGWFEAGMRSLPDERAALGFLAARGIPLVVHSSRTRAEIERLHQTLQILAPFISENGSALFLPRGSVPFVPAQARPAVGGDVIEFGRGYHQVVDALRQTCRELGVEIVGFADLSIDGVARELGVAMVEAQLAKLREYTEPFRIADESGATQSRLSRALHRHGLRCGRMGRHHLVTGTPDRADGLRALRSIWKQAWGEPVVIGLGASDDDVSWLRHVDVAIFIRSDAGEAPARVLARVPGVHVTKSSGRRGWSEAIFEHVGRQLSPGVRSQPATI